MKRNKMKLTPWMIIKRGHYFYHFYYWLYTVISDYRLAKRTLNQTVFNESKCAFPAQCISYPYIRELVVHMDLSEKDVFVDVGCAWGRLLGYLSKKSTVGQLIGVELNEKIAGFAKNIFQGNENVKILPGNILTTFPAEGTVFYLFNPFDAEVLEAFLDKMEAEIKHSVRLYYLHPTCRDVIERRTDRWRLLSEKQLKPKHLGELTLCAYEFNGAEE